MLYLINTYSGGGSHRCPLAFAAAAPQCRIVNEMIGAGFSTPHYSSQLVQRSECERVDMDRERLFADETVPRAHVVNVTDADDEGNVPASLVASCWWFARRHPQHVPISLLLTGKSCSSLEALRRLDFAHRVEVLYIAEPTTSAGPDYLSPLATFTNVRKVCEFSPCGDVRWMLSCPQLVYVDVMGYNRPADWNAAEVFPQLPALTELIVYVGGMGCVSWLPKCTKLMKLTLDGCEWLKNCDTFSTMPDLTYLKLVFDELTDLSGLTHCPKLQFLDCGGTDELTDGSALGSLDQLKELRISHTGITNIDWISGCTALETLCLYNVHIDAGFDALVGLRFLRSIDLIAGDPFDFAWVTTAQCPLEEVAVESYAVESAVLGLEHLRNARMLKKLSLQSSALYDWVGDCVMLEELSIVCRTGTADVLDRLFSLPHLRSLSLTIRGDGEAAAAGATNASGARPVSTGHVAPLEDVHVRSSENELVDGVHLLDCIRHCASLRRLTLSGVPLLGADGAWLRSLTSLQYLTVSQCEAPAALDDVGFRVRLKEVAIHNVRQWRGFGDRWECRELEKLDIRACDDLSDLSALLSGPPLHHLTTVILSKLSIADFSFLGHATAVREVIMTSLPHLVTVAALRRCRNVSCFRLDGCPLVQSLDGLEGCCSSLTECELTGCATLADTTTLRSMTELKKLTVHHLPMVTRLYLGPNSRRLEEVSVSSCPSITKINGIVNCERLQKLCLFSNAALECLPPLRGCKSLVSARLKELPRVRDLSPLVDCSASLKEVWLGNCDGVEDLSVLTRLPHLTTLQLSDCSLSDLSWISQCTSLRGLTLSQCTGTGDYSGIAKLVNLVELALYDCAVTDIRWVSQLPSPPFGSLQVRRCTQLVIRDRDRHSLPAFADIR